MRISLLLCGLVFAHVALAEPAFDWTRARQLFQRSQSGEKLSEPDQQFLDEAKRRRAAGERPAGGEPAPAPQASVQLTPLTELKKPYRGQDGGLYGGGQNEPPAAHAALARKAIAEIRPLDGDGHPASDGKVGLLSIGMSNTTQEFSAFLPKAKVDERKARHVVIVDGAQGGKDATAWATADAQPWAVAEQRLRAAGVTPAQVGTVWIKQALMGPQTGFPAETERLRDRLREIVLLAKQKYPNLRVAYLSSRIYAGFAKTRLNPEPYAYESAFAVRWLIQEQMCGDPALNADAAKGDVKAPVLLWGALSLGRWRDAAGGRRAHLHGGRIRRRRHASRQRRARKSRAPASRFLHHECVREAVVHRGAIIGDASPHSHAHSDSTCAALPSRSQPSSCA